MVMMNIEISNDISIMDYMGTFEESKAWIRQECEALIRQECEQIYKNCIDYDSLLTHMAFIARSKLAPHEELHKRLCPLDEPWFVWKNSEIMVIITATGVETWDNKIEIRRSSAHLDHCKKNCKWKFTPTNST